MKHVIDCEAVHNWRNYVGKLHYFADLSATARAAIIAAHDRHHQRTDAREEVYRLCNEFPAEFEAAVHI